MWFNYYKNKFDGSYKAGYRYESREEAVEYVDLRGLYKLVGRYRVKAK